MNTSAGSPSVTNVLLVRHGRTVANAEARFSGRDDLRLDDLGENQARDLARAVRTAAIGRGIAVVSSPLERCRHTAQAIADECLGDRSAITTDDRFIELDYGEWDGLKLSEVPAQAWRDWRNDAQFTPPGGESLRSVTARVGEGLDDWVRRSPGGTLVVASHVSPIKAAVIWALGAGEEMTWRMRLSNASITRLEVSVSAERGRGGGKLRATLVGFNETMHLEPSP